MENLECHLDEILNYIKKPQSDVLFKIIGICKENEYNYLVKSIYDYCIENNCIVYDCSVKLLIEKNIENVVKSSVENMNLYDLWNEEIVLTNSPVLNRKIKCAIVEIVEPFLINFNKFQNDIEKCDFLAKQIVWLYEAINKVGSENISEKIVLAYGDFSFEEIVHIKLLKLIGFPIVFINSNNDVDIITSDKVKINTVNFECTAPIKKCSERIVNAPESLTQDDSFDDIKEGTVSNYGDEEVVSTWAKQAKDEYNSVMRSNAGIFGFWQFQKGYTKPIYINAVIEDINTYWEQDAKFRPEFKVVDDLVYVPCFISKINGVYSDLIKYKELVDKLRNSQLTIFKEGNNIINNDFDREVTCSLVFCIENSKFNLEKLKENSLYKLNISNIDVQKFIINKLNDFLSKVEGHLNDLDIINLVASVISMDEEYLKLIESFDYPFKIPKLVLYLSDRSSYDKNTSLFILFLSSLGLDIVLLSPTGSQSIEEHLYGKYLNTLNLEELNFDLSISKLNSIKSNETFSFIKKIFSI